MYIQKAGQFSKSKTICVTFLFTKSQTLSVYAIFRVIFETGINLYIQKLWHFALCHVFIYNKPETSEKSKTICVTFFYMQETWHFALRDFSWNFWNWRRGDHFYKQKTMHFALNFYMQKKSPSVTFLCTNIQTLCVTFLYWKHCTLRYVAICKEPDTMRYILISKKQCTFCYIFICIIYSVVLIPNYERTYNQSDQIEK